MARPVRCPMGVPVAGGIEAECPTHHATEHHLPATTRTRQAGDGNKSRNNFTALHPFAPDAQTAAGQAPAAQTATVPAHSPTPNQGAPWSRRGAHPATAGNPANPPPHHLGQPNPPTERPATQAESVSPRPISGASPLPHPLPRSAFHLHFTADHISMSPSSESGCASTHAFRQPANAETQETKTTHHRGHPLILTNLSSSPGIFTAGGRRCIATVTTRP
jgi:hypothetical protein